MENQLLQASEAVLKGVLKARLCRPGHRGGGGAPVAADGVHCGWVLPGGLRQLEAPGEAHVALLELEALLEAEAGQEAAPPPLRDLGQGRHDDGGSVQARVALHVGKDELVRLGQLSHKEVKKEDGNEDCEDRNRHQHPQVVIEFWQVLLAGQIAIIHILNENLLWHIPNSN